MNEYYVLIVGGLLILREVLYGGNLVQSQNKTTKYKTQ